MVRSEGELPGILWPMHVAFVDPNCLLNEAQVNLFQHITVYQCLKNYRLMHKYHSKEIKTISRVYFNGISWFFVFVLVLELVCCILYTLIVFGTCGRKEEKSRLSNIDACQCSKAASVLLNCHKGRYPKGDFTRNCNVITIALKHRKWFHVGKNESINPNAPLILHWLNDKLSNRMPFGI